MNSLAQILKPIDRGAGRRTAIEVYDILQSYILNGALKPGTVISQVAIASALNVSRTPVREAMRMLQEGGLLIGEPNYRCRVVGFDPLDIEALYVKRIPLEALAVALTVKQMNDEKAAGLHSLITELEGDQAHADFHEWQRLHREFHRRIASEGGHVLAGDLEQLELRSERYQTVYKGAHLPGWWQRGEAEHRELFAAMKDRDFQMAGELAARHLARTALELLAALAPEFDTTRLRTALRFTIEGLKAV